MYKQNLDFELRNLKMGDDKVFNSPSPETEILPIPPKVIQTQQQFSKSKIPHFKKPKYVKTNNKIKNKINLLKRSHSLPAKINNCGYDFNKIKKTLFNTTDLSTITNLLSFKSNINDIKNLKEILENSGVLTRLLTDYEEKEIKTIARYESSFKIIHYLGGTFKTNYEFGIKDLDDYYIFVKNDHIMYRYKTITKIGKGMYGKVIKCYDYKNKQECALKISRNNYNYKKSFKNETDILKILNYNLEYYTRVSQTKSDLISLFYKTFIWRGHGIISLKLYDKNLFSANINSYNKYAIRTIMIDIFEALNYCCFHGIIHGDLKPENIFYVNSTSYHVVIGDFGLSVNTSNNTKKTHYIQTLWYRSPEVIFRLPYNYSIDIWSVGVIILELIVNKPVFKSQKESVIYYQISQFLVKPNYYGIPLNTNREHELINEFKEYIFHNDILYFNRRICDINKIISNPDYSNIVSLVKNHLLLWDPTKRFTASQALKFILNDYTIKK
tara:strand:+ start:2405 stop:3898 length:1494 start_codon:yes stop_codon:yes gene_type:complete